MESAVNGIRSFANSMWEKASTTNSSDIATTASIVFSNLLEIVIRASVVMVAWNYAVPLLFREDLSLVNYIGFGTALALIILIMALTPKMSHAGCEPIGNHHNHQKRETDAPV